MKNKKQQEQFYQIECINCNNRLISLIGIQEKKDGRIIQMRCETCGTLQDMIIPKIFIEFKNGDKK